MSLLWSSRISGISKYLSGLFRVVHKHILILLILDIIIIGWKSERNFIIISAKFIWFYSSESVILNLIIRNILISVFQSPYRILYHYSSFGWHKGTQTHLHENFDFEWILYSFYLFARVIAMALFLFWLRSWRYFIAKLWDFLKYLFLNLK